MQVPDCNCGTGGRHPGAVGRLRRCHHCHHLPCLHLNRCKSTAQSHLQAGTGLIAVGMIVVNLEKLQRSKGTAQPVPEGSAAGGEAGLPQHRYQPLGHPVPAAQAGGGWWRRLWGRGASQQQQAQRTQQAQQQQQLSEQGDWSPDYRGRLKAKHSGRDLELHLELGAAPHGEGERNGSSSGGGGGLNGSGGTAAGSRAWS